MGISRSGMLRRRRAGEMRKSPPSPSHPPPPPRLCVCVSVREIENKVESMNNIGGGDGVNSGGGGEGRKGVGVGVTDKSVQRRTVRVRAHAALRNTFDTCPYSPSPSYFRLRLA